MIGVVVPTLGQRPAMLEMCIRSLLESGVETELVIVAPPEQVAPIRNHYPRLRVVPQTAHGLAATITEGWAHLSEHRYRTWLGDDDMVAPGALRLALEVLEQHPNASMVYGHCFVVDELSRPLMELRPGRRACPILRLGANSINQAGCLYRSSAVDNVGGLNFALGLTFDVDLHRRLLRAGPAIYVPHVLGIARAHPTSLTVANFSRAAEEARAQLRSYVPAGVRFAATPMERLATLACRVSSRLTTRKYNHSRYAPSPWPSL